MSLESSRNGRTQSRRGRGRGNKQRLALPTLGTTSSQPRVQLMAEWRALEEDRAARMLQRVIKGHLVRLWISNLVADRYERRYDSIMRQYFYVNLLTNESSWEQPDAIKLFVASDASLRARRMEPLTKLEAATSIQRCGRAYLARRLMQRMVRENYMKLFDTSTQTFYYLDTRTNSRLEDKPAFLKNGNDDIPIEPYYYRKAVVKIATPTKSLHDSGIIGYFAGVLCVLTNGHSIPSREVATESYVVCNHADNLLPFHVQLQSENFFLQVSIKDIFQGTNDSHKFVFCALNEEAFKNAAGGSVIPLRLELNDRKLGCAGWNRIDRGHHVEVVGHPYGRMQAVYARQIQDLLPSSVKARQVKYDTTTETGTDGAAVFTIGGKLIGLQPYNPLTTSPDGCYCIQPILETAQSCVTPPVPKVLTTCVGVHDVQVFWQVRKNEKTNAGLDIWFELEMGQRPDKNGLIRFARVYSGRNQHYHLLHLEAASAYHLRCRSVNQAAVSDWSSSVLLSTLSPPTLQWQTRYCSNLDDAIKQLKRALRRQDTAAILSLLEWIRHRLEQASRSMQNYTLATCELELNACGGLQILLDTLLRLPSHEDATRMVMAVLTLLSELGGPTQQLLSTAACVEWACQRIVEKPTAACLRFLASVVHGNDSGKHYFESSNGLDVVIQLLSNPIEVDHVSDAPRIDAEGKREALRLLAKFSHANPDGNRSLLSLMALETCQDMLNTFHPIDHQATVYWTLVTIGNLATYQDGTARPWLERKTKKCGLLRTIVQSKDTYQSAVDGIEARLRQQRRALRQRRNNLEEVTAICRNELDAASHEVAGLQAAVAELRLLDIEAAANGALEALFTTAQRRAQCTMRRYLQQLLLQQIARAFRTWHAFSRWQRDQQTCTQVSMVVRRIQLRFALRRWERQAARSGPRRMRGAGFVLNLRKHLLIPVRRAPTHLDA